MPKTSIKTIILLVVALFSSTNCLAFKIDTHVWVAQQVLNDIQDGNLSFVVDTTTTTVTPPLTIVNALKNQPGAYRTGAIGPDAYPDILVGQTIVHPGAANGWKTDDWLKLVLKNAQAPPK